MGDLFSKRLEEFRAAIEKLDPKDPEFFPAVDRIMRRLFKAQCANMTPPIN